MRLSQITFMLEPLEFHRELRSDVLYRSRCIFNFLSRHLHSFDIPRAPYSRICIVGSATPDERLFINSDRWLSIHTPFDANLALSLVGPALHEHFIEATLRALTYASKELSVPIGQVVQCIDDFRQAGYLNKWLQKKVANRALGMRAELWCELSPSDFKATLELYKSRQLVTRETALITKPDEIFFKHDLGGLEFSGNAINIMSKTGKLTFTLPIAAPSADANA